MFSAVFRCSQDVLNWSQIFSMISAILLYQLFDDPQLFDEQLDVWTLIIPKSTVIPPSLMVLFFFSSDQHFAFILRRTFCRRTLSQNIKLRRTSTFWKLSFWRYCNRLWQTYCFPPDIHVSKNTFLLFKLYYGEETKLDYGEETKNEYKLCSQWFR